MPSVSSTRSQRGCDPALDRDTDVIKDDPEVLPMFREAMKEQTHDRGNQYTGGKRSNATPAKADRGKAYTLTRLQKDNPEAAS
jgi:hypothetical protein